MDYISTTKTSTDTDRKCLVCSQPFNTANFTDFMNNCSGKEPVLSNELKIVFLLRKVLRIPQSALLNLLEQFGNPSDWNVHLCGPCSSIFREAEFIHRRILKFNSDFEQLAKELRCVMQESTKSASEEPHTNNGKTETTKNYANEKSKIPPRRKGPGRPRKSKPTIEIEPVASFTAVESLRQAFLHSDQNHDATEESSSKMQYNCRTVSNALAKIPIQQDTFCISFINGVREKNDINESPSDNADPEDANDDFHFLRPHTSTIIKQEKDITHTMNDNDGCIFEDDFNVEDEDSDPEWTVPDSVNDIDEGEELAKCDDLDDDGDWTESRSFGQRRSTKRKVKKLNAKGNIVNKSNIHRKIMSESLANVPSGTSIEESIEDGGSFGCPKCSKTFRRKLICHAHILKSHYGDPLPFHCHICKAKRCPTEKFFRIHMDRFHKSARNPRDPDYDPDQHSAEIFEKEVVDRIDSFPTFLDHKNESSQSDEKAPKLPDIILEKFKDDKEKVYDCAQCGRGCSSEMLRDAHVKRVHQGIANPYPCEHCHRSFPRRSALLHHLAKVHFGSSHVCPHCATRFADEILKDAHIRRVHLGDSKPFRCTVDSCSRKFYRRFQLNLHLSTQHGTKLAEIPKPKGYTDSTGVGSLSGGLGRQRGASYECTLCTLDDGTLLKVRSKKEMKKHVEKQHKGISRPYPCPICRRKFSRPWIVDQHMEIHTVRNDVAIGDDPPGVFVCVPCNKQFSKKVSLDNHLEGRPHKNNRPYVCEICSQSFRGLLCLRNHQIQKHYNDHGTNPFKCKFCDKILSSKRRLDSHIRVCHTKDANYSCPHCGHQFEHESTMLRHINVRHTKSEKFVCSQCPKSFLNEQYLGYHVLRVHSGEKPYECKYCQKRFSDKSTYNRHVEWHSDVVHDCPHCSKSGFKTRHSLRVHMRTYHKELLEESPINQKQNSVPIVEGQNSHAAIEESTAVTPAPVADQDLLNNWSSIFSTSTS